MTHGGWKVPAWLLAIAIVFAIGVHVALFLQLGTLGMTASALGFAALAVVAKHLGLAGSLRRKKQSAESQEKAHRDVDVTSGTVTADGARARRVRS